MYGKNRQLDVDEFMDEFKRSISQNDIKDILSPNVASAKKLKRRKSQDFRMTENFIDEVDDTAKFRTSSVALPFTKTFEEIDIETPPQFNMTP
jgi:hypothetical protein